MRQKMLTMENNVNLKEIERRAFLSYHKDGILDIYLGMGIAIASSIFFIEFFPGITGIIVLLPILYAASKKQYTIPRLGYVKFSDSTKGRARRSVILAVLLGVVSCVAGLFAFYSVLATGYSWVEPLISNWKITAAIILSIVFTLFGYVSELKRMYYYAIVSFLVFFSGMFISIPGYWLIITVGGIIFLNGLIHLYRFTQEYSLEHVQKNE
jgi:hypothetical protein